MKMTKKKTMSFKELVVWQKAHELVLKIYDLTSGYPKIEIYGLTSQFRRAAISIAANIAEGYKKRGKPDKLRFLNIAEASLEECRYYLLLSRDLNYGYSEEIDNLMDEVGKTIFGYYQAIKKEIY